MQELPGWLWVAEIATVTGLIAAIVATLHTGTGNRGRRAAVRVAGGAGVLLGGWLLVATLLAESPAYRSPAFGTPAVGIVLTTALVAGLLATRIPAVAAALSGPDALARLTAIQAFRVVGGLFLVAMALGQLPAVFALPAGIGDIAVGIAAPFVARRIARDPAWRSGPVAFHLLGLLDLVVAVGIGVLASPGLLQLLVTTPTTAQLSLLPLTLTPTFLVPIAVVLHIVALRQLRPARGRALFPETSPLSAA